MPEQSFEKLTTWKKAHQLMLDVHKKLIPLFPKEEKFGLADQIRRSSKSVPANIAEGSGRFYYMDNVRFCYNARGSLDETLSHLIAARDLEYCPISLYEDLRSQIEEIRRLLNGYITWLKAKKVGENEPGAKLVIHEVSPEYLADEE
ncbi:MAG: four helix bundle protein [Chloroflexi bacterium]|jgi:four helix bundle protein|nr:MAG: four helix bundle protein [Chloroflexota bacterium]